MGSRCPRSATSATSAEAARNLVARHVGIVIVLAILAPVATAQLDGDRPGDPAGRVAGAGRADRPAAEARAGARAVREVDVDSPRAGLAARSRQRARVRGDPAVYNRLAGRLDDVVVVAVLDAFRAAYLIAAALALLAAALLASAYRRPAVALAAGAGRRHAVRVRRRARPRGARAGRARGPVPRARPARHRRFAGAIQNEALRLLDRGACQVGTSREESRSRSSTPSARRRSSANTASTRAARAGCSHSWAASASSRRLDVGHGQPQPGDLLTQVHVQPARQAPRQRRDDHLVVGARVHRVLDRGQRMVADRRSRPPDRRPPPSAARRAARSPRRPRRGRDPLDRRPSAARAASTARAG